jgi:hypothetical protein
MLNRIMRLFAPSKKARSGFKLTGTWTFEVFDKDGNLKSRKVQKNLITSAGLGWVASYINGAVPPSNMSHLGVGTGTTAAAIGNTALETEVLSRVAATKSVVTTTVTNDTMRFVATIQNVSTAKDITEAALFNASTSGTMFNRAVFSAVSLAATDSMQLTLDVKAS